MSALHTHRVEVPLDGGDKRLDAFLGECPGMASRSAAAKLVEAGRVLVNDERETSKKRLLAPGDEVAYSLPEADPSQQEAKPENIPLDIRYEDDFLIVLSKQRGLVCHPAPGHPDHTLVNALVFHCGIDHLGTLQGEDRPGIVHRLDQDTTGLMLAAKDDETQAALQSAIRVRSLDRRYLTLVHGQVGPDTGMVDAAIARSTKDRLKMAVSEDPAARQSITTFSVLERFGEQRGDEGYTLLECHLFTGRTHQIRVHMDFIHHPVVGDPLYGRGDGRANLGLDRQFLHSWSLIFDHPATDRRMSFRDELPLDLLEALEGLEGRSLGRTAKGEEVVCYLDQVRVMREHGFDLWGDPMASGR